MAVPQGPAHGYRRRRGEKRPGIRCGRVCGSEREAAPSPALPLRAALPLVLLLEALDAPGRVEEPLLPGEEGMALGADLHLDGRHGGAGVDDFPAVAGDRGVNVVRMNASLHGAPPKWVSKHSRVGAKRQNGRRCERQPKARRADPRIYASWFIW